MSNVWFTADQHYNHRKVVELMNRPFESIEHMNESLIANHNSVVKAGDRVYHLGDFAWFNYQDFTSRLNGQHYLIKGNHDHRQTFKTGEGFIKTYDHKTIKIEGTLFHLSHYSHRVWPQSNYGSIHLYGHSHGMLTDYNRSGDVGVDRWGYYPVSLEQIMEALGSKPITDHHPLVRT